MPLPRVISVVLLAVAGVGHADTIDGIRTELDRIGHTERVSVDNWMPGHMLVFRRNELVEVVGLGEWSGGWKQLELVPPNVDGERSLYDRDGNKRASYRIVNRRLDGPFLVWTADGKPMIEGTFRAGLRDGIWREYDGSLMVLEAPFVAGAFDGTVIITAPGPETRRYEFRRGVRHGTFIETTLNGVTVTTYRNGRETGPASERDRDGRTERGELVDGKKEGVWETVDASGAVIESTTYRGGLADGPSWWLVRQRKQTAMYRAGELDGWSEIDADGVVTRRRWRRGELVEILPRPPSYPWRALGLDVATGAMLGETISIATRFDVSSAWGTGVASRNGERARGRYVAVGGSLAFDVPLRGDLTVSSLLSFGPSIELGWATARYDAESARRDTRIYARALPFVTTSGDAGGRIGLGVTSPSWTRHAVRAAAKASEDMVPENCPRENDDDDSDCDRILETLFVLPVVWLTTPIWTINHVEITAELDVQRRPRFGVMLGWGL